MQSSIGLSLRVLVWGRVGESWGMWIECWVLYTFVSSIGSVLCGWSDRWECIARLWSSLHWVYSEFRCGCVQLPFWIVTEFSRGLCWDSRLWIDSGNLFSLLWRVNLCTYVVIYNIVGASLYFMCACNPCIKSLYWVGEWILLLSTVNTVPTMWLSEYRGEYLIHYPSIECIAFSYTWHHLIRNESLLFEVSPTISCWSISRLTSHAIKLAPLFYLCYVVLVLDLWIGESKRSTKLFAFHQRPVRRPVQAWR